MIDLSPVYGHGAGLFNLSGAPQGYPTHGDEVMPDEVTPHDIALVLPTSGTTSQPKIVPLTQANLCVSAYNTQRALELIEQDVCLNVMSLFHSHGLMGTLLPIVVAGASVICPPRFDVTKFFDWMTMCRPTWYTAVPTIHQAILAHAEAHSDVLARCPLRFIRSASAALPPKVITALERVFQAPVIESYGLTEAASHVTCNPLPPRVRKIGSVGVSIGPDVAIRDDTGTVLPAGEVGEISIRGASIMQGYAHAPRRSDDALIQGWFRTGDQGYMDRDGYLFITGRLHDLINRGGEKVAPREVEEALLDHTAVAQAVAFAVPHAQLGEDIAAAVVLHRHARTSGNALRQFMATRLADFKVPRQIHIVEHLPKGPTGKLHV